MESAASQYSRKERADWLAVGHVLNVRDAINASPTGVFNDRREPLPIPKSKAAVNGHLVNDHEYTAGGAGNSGRNLPTARELYQQHEDLHARGEHGGHTH